MKEEMRGKKTEDGPRKPEDGGRKAEDKRRDAASTPEKKPPAFDRAKAEPIDPARRHEPTGRTVAWKQEGWLYSATGAPVAETEGKGNAVPSEATRPVAKQAGTTLKEGG